MQRVGHHGYEDITLGADDCTAHGHATVARTEAKLLILCGISGGRVLTQDREIGVRLAEIGHDFSYPYLTSLMISDIIYIAMRTTINVDDDVLELARALAAARQISLGAAVSYLVRRGASARTRHRIRNGFHTFAIEPGLTRFGPDDIREVLDEEDSSSAPLFSKRE